MNQNRRLHGEELDALYATKMAAWDDRRLRWEMDNVAKRDAEGNHEWGTPEVMAAWRKGMDAEAKRRGLKPDYFDGEIVGIDNDGRLILWDRDGEVEYNCGETLETYGISDLTDREKARIGLTP